MFPGRNGEHIFKPERRHPDFPPRNPGPRSRSLSLSKAAFWNPPGVGRFRPIIVAVLRLASDIHV
jgi:hypothetical protein